MSSCEHGNETFSKNNSSQNFSYFVIYCILNIILRRKTNFIRKKAILFTSFSQVHSWIRPAQLSELFQPNLLPEIIWAILLLFKIFKIIIINLGRKIEARNNVNDGQLHMSI